LEGSGDCALDSSGTVEFVPLGVFGEAGNAEPPMLPSPEPPRPRLAAESRAGAIEIALSNGARVSVDAFVNEKALTRVLRAMKGAT
jgi:transposase